MPGNLNKHYGGQRARRKEVDFNNSNRPSDRRTNGRFTEDSFDYRRQPRARPDPRRGSASEGSKAGLRRHAHGPSAPQRTGEALDPSLNSDPARLVFLSLSTPRFLGSAQRRGAGGACYLLSLGPP